MALRSYMPRKSIGAMPSCLIRRVCRSSLLPELPVVFRGLLRPPAVTVRKSPSFGRLLFKALFFVEFGLEYLRVDNCLAQVEILRNFRYSLRCRMLVPCCVLFVQDFFVEMPSVRSVFASGVPPGAFEIGRFAGDFTESGRRCGLLHCGAQSVGFRSGYGLLTVRVPHFIRRLRVPRGPSFVLSVLLGLVSLFFRLFASLRGRVEQHGCKNRHDPYYG